MKRATTLLSAVLTVSSCFYAQTAKNPFAKLGYNKKQLLYTSSKGEYEEFHDQTDVVEIGSVLFNTKTNQIAGFVSEERAAVEVSPAITAMSIDPLCEKYYWISPYAYCLNNPIKFVDPNGEDIWEINGKGRIVNRIENKDYDQFAMVDKDGNRMMDKDGNAIQTREFKYGTVESQETYTFSPDGKTIDTFDVYQVKGDDAGTEIFNFMSDNVTGTSGVEFSHIMTGESGDKGLNFLTTSHEQQRESGMMHLVNGQLRNGYFIREYNHSHPYSDFPSGLRTRTSDMGFINSISDINRFWGTKEPKYHIYHVPTKKLIEYKTTSKPSEFGLVP